MDQIDSIVYNSDNPQVQAILQLRNQSRLEQALLLSEEEEIDSEQELIQDKEADDRDLEEAIELIEEIDDSSYYQIIPAGRFIPPKTYKPTVSNILRHISIDRLDSTPGRNHS